MTAGTRSLVCNTRTEQDFNGNDVLRYSTVAEGAFIVGVTASGATWVRAELRGGTVVDQATVAATFTTSARFVAVPLPADAVIRALVALDSTGRELTRITINPEVCPRPTCSTL